MEEITIVVVDDHPLLRQGVIDSLMVESDFTIIGEAASGEEGLELIRILKPRIAVVDINLPGINGLQLTQRVISEKLPTRVVLLTAYDDGEQRKSAMHAGASAYCTKDVQPEGLVHVVREVAFGNYPFGKEGEFVLDINQLPGVQNIRAISSAGDDVESYHPLSRREMEVLSYIAQGMSNKEIGATLGISEQTVKNHITTIFNKLGVSDRTQATLYALQHGWVRLSN
jgi:DNA-binding NarL/FixJ family response regulator